MKNSMTKTQIYKKFPFWFWWKIDKKNDNAKARFTKKILMALPIPFDKPCNCPHCNFAK